jgi:hypothetical protein
MPMNPLIARWGAALLGATLVFGGSVASSATPLAPIDPEPDASVAASDGQPTNLALAMPIITPVAATGLITAADLEEFTAPSGVLTRQLDASIDRPIALGIDPRIIASIRILGTSAPASAVDWLERLEGANNETFALAYGDADVAALSQAGMSPISIPVDFPIDPALFPGGATVEPDADTEPDTDNENNAPDASPSPSPGTSSTTSPSPSPSPTPAPGEPTVPTGADLVSLPFSLGPIAWPRDNSAVTADIPVFSAAEETTTILQSTNVTYGRDAIPALAQTGGMPLLVSNTDISELFRSAASATSELAWTAAMTELTAALAGWTGGSAPVLATLDRELITSTNRVAETLDALVASPGIDITGFDDVLEEAPVEVGMVDFPQDPTRITQLQSMLATEPATSAFATVLSDPTIITGEQRRTLLTLASNGWAESVGDWTGAVQTYVAAAGEILASVQMLESSTINLLSDTGDLPITISNALPYPVTVVVHVTANTGILDVLEDYVTVTIEAESQARAAVPVQSIANGTAVLIVTLTSPSQVPVAAPVFVTTNVQAGWETAFTTTVAVIVLIVFVLGIIRTVTKRRRERREREATATDASAVPPLEGDA